MVFIVPAILAGLLGLLANAADDPAAYVPRLRLMFLGAVGLGYLGLALFVWLMARGWRRWGALLLALAAIRVAYVPTVATAVLVTGWVDWLGRLLGTTKLEGPIHYALACLVAGLAGLVALAPVAAAAHPKRIGSIFVLLAFVGLGFLAFWHPEDRRVLPHPFADEALAPVSAGPEYLDVVEDPQRKPVTRILAAGGGLRHALSSRRGWGAAVRGQLIDRYRNNPDLSLGARVSCLEAALLHARTSLEVKPEDRRTSPRTPP